MEENLVYHYCSGSTFKEIIEKKTLRFSDITKSNDSAEIRWITKHIESAFLDEFDKAYKRKSFEDACQKTDFLKYFHKFVDAYFSKAIFGNEKFFWFYASCLSHEGDLLSQWRGYADDGKGFSIGFDQAAFEKYTTSGFKLLSIHCGDVEYNEKRQITIVSDSIKNLFADFDNAIEINDLSRENIMHIFKSCFQELIEKAVFIKNPFFSEEKEWRMCVWTFNGFSDTNDILLVNDGVPEKYPLEYQNKDDELISFFDLKFAPDMVKRIVLGPKNKTDLAELSIFLKSNGFECKPKKSDGTYV